MSTTTTPTSTDNHVSPQRAFDRLVWHNPRVCNGCFEHVKSVDKACLTRGRAEPLDVEDHHRTEHATLEQDIEAMDPAPEGQSRDSYGERGRAVPRTTCRNCARIGCWADDDTLSKVQAVRLTTPLSNRLEEADLEFNERVLRQAVRLFKENEDVQGYDTEIFRRSVKLAINRG
ncbi:hypothetical protein [Halosolutus halophilus]|uniref:hypothetical protein n=1 Tax=Halosolutus halophilus TaxID=1552990 RepID=UPI00223507A0|nr:hypothetical protein [Halosolutus halophilus]